MERVVVVKSGLMLYTQIEQLLRDVLKLVSNKFGLGWAWGRSLLRGLLQAQSILVHLLESADLGMRLFLFLVAFRNRLLHLTMSTNVGQVSGMFSYSTTSRNTVG